MAIPIQIGGALLAAVILAGSAARAQLEEPQSLPIDVSSATVLGAILVDGAPAPPGAGEQALVHLWALDAPTQATTQVTLGGTSAQAYGPAKIVAGDYVPAYEFLFSSGALPENPMAEVGPATLLSGDTTFDIDIPTVEITFTFTVDGVAPPSASSQAGSIWLRHVATGGEMWVASTHVGGGTIRVIPGTYDVVYRHQAGDTMPQNQNATVLPAISLIASQSIALDVPRRTQQLSFLLNGVPFSTSTYAEGEIKLIDSTTGDSVSFGPTSAGAATRTVLPGVYDVTYSALDLSSLVPQNTNALVSKAIQLDSGGGGFPLLGSIDVQAASISLEATLNGAPNFPTSLYERGAIFLVGSGGDEVLLSTTDESTPAAVLVVAGKYDAHYRHLDGTTIVPRNPDVRVESGIAIVGDATLPVDVPAIEVIPAFTLDGVPFPTSQYERGDFHLIGALPEDRIPLGSSHETPSGTILVPGRYDVEWDWQDGDTIVPQNLQHIVERGLQLDSVQILSIDVPTRVIAPSFTLDGVPFPTDPAQAGRVGLRPLYGGGGVDIGSTSQEIPDEVRVIRDIYAIEYDWTSGLAVPRNEDHPVGYVNVPEPSLGAGLAAGSLLLAQLARRRRRSHGCARVAA